jgi:hypothetical protein
MYTCKHVHSSAHNTGSRGDVEKGRGRGGESAMPSTRWAAKGIFNGKEDVSLSLRILLSVALKRISYLRRSFCVQTKEKTHLC